MLRELRLVLRDGAERVIERGDELRGPQALDGRQPLRLPPSALPGRRGQKTKAGRLRAGQASAEQLGHEGVAEELGAFPRSSECWDFRVPCLTRVSPS